MQDEFEGLNRPEVLRFMKEASKWNAEQLALAVELLTMLSSGVSLEEAMRRGNEEMRKLRAGRA